MEAFTKMITIGYVDKNGQVLLKTVPDIDNSFIENIPFEFEFKFDNSSDAIFFCGIIIMIILSLFLLTWYNCKTLKYNIGNKKIIDTV